MAKRRSRKDSLTSARKYAEILLYEASGGSMGKAPDSLKTTEMTFGEKRGLLDSLIKIATLEHKVTPESDESGFDIIKKGLSNASAENGSGRNLGGAESIAIDPRIVGTERDEEEDPDS